MKTVNAAARRRNEDPETHPPDCPVVRVPDAGDPQLVILHGYTGDGVCPDPVCSLVHIQKEIVKDMEIKFRAKSLYNGEWVYGQYHTYGDGAFIAETKFESNNGKDWRVPAIEVDPGTVGQYIGLHDKNGREIYEGDRLRIDYHKLALGANLGVMEVDATLTGVVSFDGLCIQLEEIAGEKWEDYTGYPPGEGSCPIMYLHDVYEGSDSAEWQIEVIE